MPVFGNRMVCETANVKRQQERRQNMKEREEKLAKWFTEKEKRKQQLRSLRGLDGPAPRRLSSTSTCSNMSSARRDSAMSVGSCGGGGPDSRRPSETSTIPPGSPTSVEMDSDTQHIMESNRGKKKETSCGDACVIS